MEKPIEDLLQLFLPEGLLDYFDVEAVRESKAKDHTPMIKIHLVEKNSIPEGHDPNQFESKGFYEEKTIQDFPVRGKYVYLVIKRRRWRHKTDRNRSISNDYSFLIKGTKMTREFSDFLKGTR